MTEQAEKQPFWEARGLPPPGTRMTGEDFDALPEVNFYVELIHGVVIYPHWNEDMMTAAPIPDHQDIVGNVYTLLRAYATQHGGKASIAPLDVYLSAIERVQPDVIWCAPESQAIRTDKNYRGAPELVVEVLSPGTASRDKTDKFDLYEKHGVWEYWIVDPRDSIIEVYVRKDNALHRLGGFKQSDTFNSPILNQYSIPVRELFLI